MRITLIFIFHITMTHVLRQEGQGRRQRRSVAFKDIEIAYLKTDIDNLKSKLAEAEAQHQIKLVEAEAQHQIKLAEAEAQHQIKLAEAEAFNKTIHEMLIENIVNLRQKILREFNKHQIELENLRAQYRA
jgi:regulator of protease activity HflC (stomatin/prohibitin superfamily)